VCRAAGEILVARAAPHFGEEPCISGTRGSGAVFFAGCPLGCVYCQNFDLSRARTGRPVTVGRLSEIFRELEEQGVHNLNLVTGTPYVPAILEALERAEPGIPVVWNTSGYETAETVRALSERVSVFLPDMKYALPEPARRYSRAGDYPEIAAAAIREMVRVTGPWETDDDGLLRRGVLIRHLVLPGQGENTRRVIRWVDEEFLPGEALFSLMAQYTPWGALERFPELNRPITADEWDDALAALEDSGIEDGYVQEPDASGAEAIPAFDGTGV
jgi:putative pyruvate formate lyase activating enzyme